MSDLFEKDYYALRPQLYYDAVAGRGSWKRLFCRLLGHRWGMPRLIPPSTLFDTCIRCGYTPRPRTLQADRSIP